MNRFLPQLRLQHVARRLTDQYPDPPRFVSPVVVVEVYGPLLASQALLIVSVFAIALLVRPGRVVSSIGLLAAVMLLGGVVLVWGLASAVLGALRSGVYATSEVVSAAGSKTTVQTTLHGQRVEMGFTARGSYRPGTRLDVLVDPEKKKVLLVLGPPMS